MSPRRLGLLQGSLIAGQKSAEGIVDHVVGQASEAPDYQRWSQPIGRAGNGGRRPEREERRVGYESQEQHAAEHPDGTGLPFRARG